MASLQSLRVKKLKAHKSAKDPEARVSRWRRRLFGH